MKYQNSAHRRMHLSFLVTCVIIHTYIHTYSKEELTVTYLFVICKKYTQLKRNQKLQETNQSVFKDVCQEGTGIVGVKKIKNDYN